GAKTAERLAHHILKCPTEEALALAEAIRGAKDRVRPCATCYHLTESDEPLCVIFPDPRRGASVILVLDTSPALPSFGKARGVSGGVPRPRRVRAAARLRARPVDARCAGIPGALGGRARGHPGHEPEPRRRRNRPARGRPPQ